MKGTVGHGITYNRTKEEGKLIVFVKDSHTKDSIEFLRYGGKEHCLKNTTEALLIRVLEELEKAEDTISIEKNSTNFMESHQMRELMENQTEMEEFDIVGCLTDICVMNGAIGLTTYLDERNRLENNSKSDNRYNRDNYYRNRPSFGRGRDSLPAHHFKCEGCGRQSCG